MNSNETRIIIILPFHLSVHIIMVMVMLHHTSGSNHLIFMGEGAMEFKKKKKNSLINDHEVEVSYNRGNPRHLGTWTSRYWLGHLGTRSWTFRYWPGHLGTRYWTVRDLDETKTKSSYLIHFGLHSPSVLYSGTCISLSFYRFICLYTLLWSW
jgi:hypothetical protein